MIPMEKLNIQNLVDGSASKPGKILIREKVLLVIHKEPEPEMIDVRHFS
jgi:hypothetical protein